MLFSKSAGPETSIPLGMAFKKFIIKKNDWIHQHWNQVGLPESSGLQFLQVIGSDYPGHLALKVWPRLDHMWREIKEYMIWRRNDADVHSSLATPTFWIHTLMSDSSWKPHPCFVCIICTKSDHLATVLHGATPIYRLLLQAPGVLFLQYFGFTWDCCCTKQMQ